MVGLLYFHNYGYNDCNFSCMMSILKIIGLQNNAY